MDTEKYSLTSTRSHENISLSWQSAQAAARLERLEVDLGGCSGETIEKVMVTIVVNARELERVVFFTSPQYVRRTWNSACYMFRLVRVLESRALRQIWLREVVILPKHLVAMLRKHKDTLGELTMFNVLLLGSWNEILSMIRDELCLSSLIMINLLAANEYEFKHTLGDPRINNSLEGGIELRGNEKVIAGIGEILGQWNRQRADPDYKPSWRSAIDMSHLAYPED